MMTPIGWANFGGGVFAALVLIFCTHRYDAAVYAVEKAAAVSAQAAADGKRCDDDKAKTKEANNDLQKNLTDVKRKLAAAKRVHPAACVPVITGGADMAGVHGGYAGKNGAGISSDAAASGISSDWLRDYGATCEEIHRTLNVCEKFVHDERTVE